MKAKTLFGIEHSIVLHGPVWFNLQTLSVARIKSLGRENSESESGVSVHSHVF